MVEPVNVPLQFRFTVPIPPNGLAVTVEECERLILERLEKDSSSRKQSLWDLSVIYSVTDRQERSLECLKRLAVLTEGPEERARCYLAMGAQREQVGDFEGAVGYYRAAFETEPQNTNAWYWINNNLGYSLVQLGRCRESEAYLHRAMAIDQDRPNAYKNLGLAFLGQDRLKECADCFVRATQADASDRRSLDHLVQLVSAHPELLAEVPDLGRKIEDCRQAVLLAATAQPDFRGQWERLRKSQRKPWWAFWR
jgi:tetratricopeptide (TPR) repeat protein